MKHDLSSDELKTLARAASKRAVERARAMKISYTVQEGKRIVQHQPDGKKKIIGQLKKAFVKPSQKSYRIPPQ